MPDEVVSKKYIVFGKYFFFYAFDAFEGGTKNIELYELKLESGTRFAVTRTSPEYYIFWFALGR